MESLKRIRELGGLHDAEVRSLTVGFVDRVLRLELDDFYANFQGYAGYPGVVPGSVVFTGISNVKVDLEPFASPDEVPWIYEFEATAVEQEVDFVITFWPAGRITGSAKTIEITEKVPGNFRTADS